MPIFGQVWLWSSLAFLLGAVLCWLLVARPARNRVGELEAQLASRAHRPAVPEPARDRRRDDETDFVRGQGPGLGDRDESQYLTRSLGLRDTPPLPPERGRLAAYADPEPPRDFADQQGPRDFADPQGSRDFAAPESPRDFADPQVPGGFAAPEPPRDYSDPQALPDFADPQPSRDFAEPEQPPRDFATEPEQEPFSFSGSHAVQDTELADAPHNAAATQYLDVSSGSLTAPPEVPPMSPAPSDRGWFDDELEGDAANQGPEEQAPVPRNRHHLEEREDYSAHLVDDEDHDAAAISSALDAEADEEPRSAVEDEDGGTVFTQRTHPIPGELIRQIDESGKEERARAEEAEGEHRGERVGLGDRLVDDLAEGPAETDHRERTAAAEAVTPPAVFTEPEPEPAAVFTEPEPEVTPEPVRQQEQTEVVTAVAPVTEEKPEPKATRTASDLPKRVPQQNRISQGVSVRVEPTPTALPKRVPGKPRHQIPFGVEPAPTPEPAAVGSVSASASAEASEAARSLFEPIIPAADEGTSTPPPPHRLRQGTGGGRGPFGPGSAMPLPGGASPSPEFTIKASVAALRYCTPESPQFGRTVAEVWFRSAADAERVGFRPVG